MGETLVPFEELLSVDDIIIKTHNEYDEMLLIKYPIPVVVVAVYLVTLWAGMRWMKDIPPFNLKYVLRVYNTLQIIFNIILLLPYIVYISGIPKLLNRICSSNPDDFEVLYSESYSAYRRAYFFFTWLYLVVKMTDLLDTIFMVLMKNNSHITFLHVYHHSAMVVFGWLTLHYALGFHAVFPGTLNAIVHLCMYTYYLLSTFGPSVKKYLWWKKYLTSFQIGQFFLVLAYLLTLFYKGCSIKPSFIYIWASNVGLFLCLFVNFYLKTYSKKTKSTDIHNKNK